MLLVVLLPASVAGEVMGMGRRDIITGPAP